MRPGNDNGGWRVEQLGEWRVLFVVATEHEVGPCLRAMLRPLVTGVGPVEAAVSLSHALTTLGLQESAPDLVVSLGSAGSALLQHAQVYQVATVCYRDMDASPLGFEPGKTPFSDLPGTLTPPMRVPGLPEATLSTGADFISGQAYRAIAADMVDMETYAVLRACQEHGVSMIGLRGISDGRADVGSMADWSDSLADVERNLAAAVELLRTALTSGALGVPSKPPA